MTEDEFMAEQKRLLDVGEYSEFIWNWSAETYNSTEFKKAAFADYTPGSTDVIVSTYPKSGTTWMLQMAHQISFLGEGNFDHQYEVVPWPDAIIPIPNLISIDDLSVADKSPSTLRIVKSHLEAEFIPYTAEAKYIAVLRDPKEVLVSMTLFENGFNELLFGKSVPTDAFVTSFQSGRFQYQDWPAFIDSWWKLKDRDNVLVVTYGEMKADSDAMIRRVAGFMGVGLTDDQVEKVAARTSFNYMKENEHLFAQPAWDEGNVELVRSGKRGNTKELLTPEQQQQIDAYCLRELERLGSDFPFGDKFDVVA